MAFGQRKESVEVRPEGERRDVPWFADVTQEVGLGFEHEPSSDSDYFMPRIMGSGGAFLDIDGDGRLDLYLVQNGGPDSRSTNRLFRQTEEGRFVDVSDGSGLDVSGYGMGVAVGDVNNDGASDVLLTEYGGIRLFLNRGGRFLDATRQAALDNPQWATSASFLDYDRDGWLDLVVANYVEYDPRTECDDRAGKPDFCGPSTFAGTVTRLFHNLGARAETMAETAVFEDVTLESGLGQAKGPGLGVVCGDFDGDRWTDILIANDGAPNHLWLNQRDGRFDEEAVPRGIAYNAMGNPQANMGIAVGDVDGDALADVFITHLFVEQHVCWKQGPPGYFHDATSSMGLGIPECRSTGFGAVFADLDQDGSLDLAIANGAVKRKANQMSEGAPRSFWDTYAERNQLLMNDGTGRFRDVSPENPAFCGVGGVFRGLACADVDNDGSLDLLLIQVAGPARLFRNIAPGRGHWLIVRAIDPALGGRDAYGAEITIKAGGRKSMRWLNPGYSYLCSNDPRAHFGLGTAEEVDSIHVSWPDGTEEDFPGTSADRMLVLEKGEGVLP